MSRPRRGALSGAVLVFAESLNDSQSIRELVLAANPGLAGRVRTLPRPTSLTRDAGSAAVRRWIDDIDKAIRAHAVRGRVSAVLVHRDADGADPDDAVAAALAAQLAAVRGHPIVPVEEIEAWWFLFPDAVEAVRPQAWKDTMPRRKRNVETIQSPKEELRRLTRTRGKTEYSEADCPAIAAKIRLMAPVPHGTSRSYDRLVALAAGLS